MTKQVPVDLEASQSENGNLVKRPIFETEDQYYAWCLEQLAIGASLETKDVVFKNEYESSLTPEETMWWSQKMSTNPMKERQVNYNG